MVGRGGGEGEAGGREGGGRGEVRRRGREEGREEMMGERRRDEEAREEEGRMRGGVGGDVKCVWGSSILNCDCIICLHSCHLMLNFDLIITTGELIYSHEYTSHIPHSYMQKQDRVEELQGWVDRHKFHIQKLEVSHQSRVSVS